MTSSSLRRIVLLAFSCSSILACDTDNDVVAPVPDPQPSSEWVTREALAVPDPDLLAVYWDENNSRYRSGGDIEMTMWSPDGMEWTLEGINGSGRVVGFASVGQSVVQVNTDGSMRCEDCAGAKYAIYSFSLAAVASNDLRAVAVGTEGHVVTHDGASQTAHDTGVAADFTDVTWDGVSSFIATATDGILRRSADGVTWTTLADTGRGRLRSIATHGSVIIVIGENGEILQRPDRGVIWERVGDHTGLRDVIWTGNSFMAVGDNGKVLISFLRTWRSVPTGVDKTLRSSSSGPRLVIVGDAGTVLVSSDGRAWERRQPARWLNFNDIIWTGTTFVASANVVGNAMPAYLSANGIDWSPVASVEDNDGIWGLENLAWSGTRAVAVAVGSGSWDGGVPQHAKFYASDDLQNWRIVHVTLNSVYPSTVVWMNGAFFVGCSNEVFRSADGETWSLVTGYERFASFRSVTVREDMAYGIEWDGRLFTSSDLVHWSSAGSVTGPGVKTDLDWTGTEFLACGYYHPNRVWWSTDGVDWQAMNPNTRFDLRGIAANDDRWVVVGENGTIRTRER